MTQGLEVQIQTVALTTHILQPLPSSSGPKHPAAALTLVLVLIL